MRTVEVVEDDDTKNNFLLRLQNKIIFLSETKIFIFFTCWLMLALLERERSCKKSGGRLQQALTSLDICKTKYEMRNAIIMIITSFCPGLDRANV